MILPYSFFIFFENNITLELELRLARPRLLLLEDFVLVASVHQLDDVVLLGHLRLAVLVHKLRKQDLYS